MAQIFPKKANALPALAAVAGVLFVAFAIFFFWYWGSPKFTDVGYRPIQPVQYSHKLHAGDMGMDCRYCHYQVEYARPANVPTTKVCMNCHTLVSVDKPNLLLVQESWGNQTSLEWTRIHKVPEYAYFDHSAHMRASIGCVTCHGNVRGMEVVQQEEPLSMGWCLECHRDPAPNLRPPSELTNMMWIPPAGHGEWSQQRMEELNLNPPEVCSGCHR